MSGRSWEKAGGLGQSLSWLAGDVAPPHRGPGCGLEVRRAAWCGRVAGTGVEMQTQAKHLSAALASVCSSNMHMSTCPGAWSVLGEHRPWRPSPGWGDTGPGGPLQATGRGIPKSLVPRERMGRLRMAPCVVGKGCGQSRAWSGVWGPPAWAKGVLVPGYPSPWPSCPGGALSFGV